MITPPTSTLDYHFYHHFIPCITTSLSRIYTGRSERVVRFHTRAYRSLRTRTTFHCQILFLERLVVCITTPQNHPAATALHHSSSSPSCSLLFLVCSVCRSQEHQSSSSNVLSSLFSLNHNHFMSFHIPHSDLQNDLFIYS